MGEFGLDPEREYPPTLGKTVVCSFDDFAHGEPGSKFQAEKYLWKVLLCMDFSCLGARSPSTFVFPVIEVDAGQRPAAGKATALLLISLMPSPPDSCNPQKIFKPRRN